jgi:hypothetical protein
LVKQVNVGAASPRIVFPQTHFASKRPHLQFVADQGHLQAQMVPLWRFVTTTHAFALADLVREA